MFFILFCLYPLYPLSVLFHFNFIFIFIILPTLTPSPEVCCFSPRRVSCSQVANLLQELGLSLKPLGSSPLSIRATPIEKQEPSLWRQDVRVL